jgi:hypothetical protein
MSWDSSSPFDTDLICFGDDKIRELKADLKTIFSKEHSFPAENAEVPANTYGIHLEGSGKIFTGTSAPSSAQNGQLFWNTSTKKLYVYKDGQWIECNLLIPYCFYVKEQKTVSNPSTYIYEYNLPSGTTYYFNTPLIFIWSGYYTSYDNNPHELQIEEYCSETSKYIRYILPTNAQHQISDAYHFHICFTHLVGSNNALKYRFKMNYTGSITIKNCLLIRGANNFEGDNPY